MSVPFGEPDAVTGAQPEFTVGYSGNDAYKTKLATLYKRAHSQMPGRDIPSKTALMLQREAMIGTVLLGWTGLYEEDANGTEDKSKPLEFNPQNAALVLGTPILYGIIEQAANNLANFQEGEEVASKAAVKSGDDLEPAVQLGTGIPV
jgi:hypothetical protein